MNAAQVKGCTAPPGVGCNSRSAAINDHSGPSTSARSSASRRTTGRPEQCVGPSGGEAAEHRDRARPAGGVQVTQIAHKVRRRRQEVHHRAVVPDVERPAGRPFADVGADPVHPRGIAAETPLRDAEGRVRDIDHGQVIVTARQQGVRHAGGSAANVDDARIGGNTGGVQHPQRHHRIGLEPAARGLALGVGLVPVLGQASPGHVIP